MEEIINEMFVQIEKLPLLIQSVSRFENCVQTLSQTVASYDAKITNIDQMVAALQPVLPPWKRMRRSSGSGSAKSCTILVHCDGSTATGSIGSHEPGSCHLMTKEIQGEDLIHSHAPKMNNHKVPFHYDSLVNNTTKGLQSGSIIFGKNPICQQTTNLS